MMNISGFGWVMGWNSMQYLLGADALPTANSNNGKSAGGLGHAGTFWFFTVITLIGGTWAWFFIPETADRRLVGMNRLFMLRRWQIGRFSGRDPDERVVAQEKLEQEKGRQERLHRSLREYEVCNWK
jgi:hypothetical protein